MRIEIERAIAATPERVFAAVVDIPGWAQRITAIERIDMLTPGPVGVGTRFRETRRMFGREATEEMWVEAIEAPHRFVLAAASNGARYRSEHALHDGGDGRTILRLAFEGRPEATWARLLSPLLALAMKGKITTMLAKDLHELAHSIEAEAAGGRGASPPSRL
jgi:uncharacterized protein YndB with AHSA1/START domain